jgi:hypothetical protein
VRPSLSSSVLGLGIDVKSGHSAVFFELMVEKCFEQLACQTIPHRGLEWAAKGNVAGEFIVWCEAVVPTSCNTIWGD